MTDSILLALILAGAVYGETEYGQCSGVGRYGKRTQRVELSSNIPDWRRHELIKGGYDDRDNNGNYFPNLTCVWIFRPAKETSLSLVFDYFEMEESENCRNDYLEIRNGRRGSSKLFGRYCGNEIPTIIKQSGPIYIKMKTNSEIQRRGFSARYNLGGCFHYYTEMEGKLHAIELPREDNQDILCEWRIHVPKGFHIRLEFLFSSTQQSWSCHLSDPSVKYSDIVYVHDGLTYNSPIIAQYCGGFTPYVLSSDNEMMIHFQTNGIQNEGNGFEAYYHTKPISCEYTINIARLSDQQEWWEGVIGHFSNPGYPVPYAADQMCSWIVSSPISHVLLTFPEFDLLDSENCHVDYVEIFDGNTDESQSFGIFCGSTAPRVVVSTAKQLYIRFVSGHVTGTGHTGFTAEYREGPFTYLNQSHGEIVERDVGHAIYFLEAAENHRIYIEFPHFNLPHTDTSGRVSIYEGFGPESMNNQIAMFFHTNAHPVLSHTNTVKLNYKMDSGWYTDGIIATYKMIETDFKEIFGAGEGNISVPMDKVYKDYEWIIYAYDDVNVVLEFQEFMLMSSNDCSKESVELRRGPSKTSALMARLCGDTIPRIFTADVIHVMFTTESIKSNSTVRMSYRSACEYNIFDSNMGQIQSPAANLYRHVSYRYDTRMCVYNISVPDGNRISLTFTNLTQLEIWQNENAYLEVIDLLTNVELGHFGRNRPDVIKSSGHKIQVRFNIYSIDFNFIAEYVTEPLDERFACAVASNVVYGEHEGNISSPNYPAPYPVHQECVWHIVTEKPASIIYLSIEDFVLEDASGPATCSCTRKSSRTLNDGPVLDSPLIGTYCGNEIPHRFVSTGPGMTLLFRSNKNKQKRGFQLHYQAKCYKVYTNPSGTIEVSQRLSQSVFFDNECTFEIQGSKDHAISLEFTALGIEFDKYISGYYPPSQASHYVDVLMGKNKELAVRYYGNMLAPWITLPTSPVYIVYHLPNRYYEPSARFNITYQREEIRCEWPSGMLYVDEYGKIKNPWRKNTYPSNQSCEFAIASQYGGPVRLRMNSVDLDAQSNTTDNWLDCVNYIEVDNRGDRLCHLKQQTQYITSGTSASVKFNSGINQGIGSFNLEYDSACGISDVPEGIPNIYEHTNNTNFNSVPRAAPWMGLLYDVDEAQYICSVVLLNNVWAISTAHCISARYGHKLQIKLGKTYSNVTEPDEVLFDIVVQNCDMYRTDYLLCLFKLDREVTSYIRPICLPTLKSKNSIRARAGSIAFTFGWGRDFDNFPSNYVLQRIPLRSIDWKTCVENKQDLWAADRTFLCAEYMDGNNGGKRCYGHSGGPLAKYHNGKWFMIGIVANGPPHSAWHNEGCPRRGKYGWFWRTVKVDTFIKNILYQD